MFGETDKKHDVNLKYWLFLLGRDKVSERTSYDHVGISVSIFPGDTDGIIERI